MTKPDHIFSVDLNDFTEKEELTSFLTLKLNTNVTVSRNKLTVKSETLSIQSLLHSITKFLYHNNLNNTYWASIDGDKVKINKFNKPLKTEKSKNKDKTQHKTLTQTWGL